LLPRSFYAAAASQALSICELLKTPLNMAALCELLEREYDGSREQIESGVLSFLVELDGEGMVRGIEEGQSPR
jgi:hypothetical protein